MYSNFARVYDSLMESVDRKAWLEYIISLFGDAKIERVADCACGTGAVSIPVSYTHLDVYKRQLLFLLMMEFV